VPEFAVSASATTASPGADAVPLARLALGYGLALAGATLYGFGGVIAKNAFTAGIAPSEMAQIRALFSFIVLFVVLAAVRPRDLRARRADLPLLAAFGLVGIAAVQGTYYEAIARLPLGVALVIQYTAPLLLLVIARRAGRSVGTRLWIAAALALIGCYFVVGAYDARLRDVNAVGTVIAVIAMLTFTAYLILAERILRTYTPWGLLLYGLAFATVGWSIYRLPTTLPWDLALANWPLVLGVVFIATLFPYVLTLGAVSLLPAARVGLTATFEPVVGALAGLALLGEVLQVPQLAGGLLVLAAIALVQTVRLRQGSV
jgi:drug/metabolite transporter (DMT)-like permease